MSEAKYVSDVPKLLSEWNYELNAGLSPDQITLSNTRRKIRWVCSNCGSIWTASAYSRYHKELCCPECDPKSHSLKYRQSHLSSVGSLASLYPDLAAEWHPALNGHLLPTEVTPYHRAKVWWKCSTCGSDFSLSPNQRVAYHQGCKQCAPTIKHKKEHFRNLKPGVNDLASQRPDLLEEWDYERNAGICTPDKVTIGSGKFKIHWICKTCGHRWQATAYNRATLNTGCKSCANRNQTLKKNLISFEKEKKINIEKKIKKEKSCVSDISQLLSEWDYESNVGLSPEKITLTNKVTKINWVCAACGNKWAESVYNRFKHDMRCPECAPKNSRLLPEQSLSVLYPDLAAEWHPVLNGHLLPTEVTPYHRAKVWWKCSTCGSDFSLSPNQRVKNNQGCRQCTLKRPSKKHLRWVIPGVNDLASQRPDLLNEWDYEKNSSICAPEELTTSSSVSVHWICSVCGHKWQVSPYSRIQKGTGCRKCAIEKRKKSQC